MLTFGSCVTFVLSVYVPPLARYLLMQLLDGGHWQQWRR